MLLTAAALLYGVLPALIDTFDPHHLLNPEWPPHARLHLLWLNSTGLYLSLFAIYLVWTATPRSSGRMRASAALGALHIAGFFTAGLFKDAAGAAFDADGRVLLGLFPPAILHFTTAAALQLGGFVLSDRAARQAATEREQGR